MNVFFLHLVGAWQLAWEHLNFFPLVIYWGEQFFFIFFVFGKSPFLLEGKKNYTHGQSRFNYKDSSTYHESTSL
jgi:hypothetical protein